jgi:uncharacterized membrane protein YoaK (UPF0700 family)
LIGGFVNSAGFVLIGASTSHVTGNLERFAKRLAQSAASRGAERANNSCLA